MIEYVFEVESGEAVRIQVQLDREFTPERDRQGVADWTALGNHRCPNCPLAEDQFRNCPAALDLEGLVAKFSSFTSFDRVLVKVISKEREYRKECDLQTGLNAVLGLVMATSACPILGKLKSMAKFHLPFATMEETVYRVVGNYLIQQYFVHKDGGEADIDLVGLEQLYKDLEAVNHAFAERVRAASDRDANINAIVRLSGLAFLVRSSLKKQLLAQRAMFFPETM